MAEEDTPSIELAEISPDEEIQALVEPERAAPASSLADIQQARRLLYVSHLFAQVSEIAWQFCLAVFLAAATNYRSLILVSSYGFVVCLASVLGTGQLGRWVDTSPRLWLVRALIAAENTAVIGATMFCYLLLSNPSQVQETGRWAGVPSHWLSIVALVFVHALGATAQVLDQTFTVAMERDWVVVLSRTASEVTLGAKPDEVFAEWLSIMNVAMKQIDLSCKMMTPAVVGFVLPLSSENTIGDLEWACIGVGALNVVALVVEYVCTARVYALVPALAHRQAPPEAKESSRQWCHELSVYFAHPIAWAGVALALLYVNALTLGNGIMTAYLLSAGLDLSVVGVLRGTASVIGLLGTCAYHYLHQRLSLESTAMLSILYQCSCLGLSFSSLFVADNTLALVLLIIGICLSRIGLWVFDISVTQMQQEEIPEHVRGSVGGVQQALNSLCNLLSFVAGFAFPSPQDFWVFVTTGFAGVALGVVMFSLGVFIPRKVLETRHEVV